MTTVEEQGGGNLKQLGAELRITRQAAGLSLSRVARPAKISATYLQKLEAGVVKNPSPRVLQRLADVLNVSYLKLMELAGYLTPSRQAGRKSRQDRLSHETLSIEGLTEEERKAVSAFVAYLRAQRKKT